MLIQNKYIRIVIGSLIPLLTYFILYYIYRVYYMNEEKYNAIFIILYGYFVLFIPLLLYSVLINIILIKTECFFCVVIISVIYAILLTNLPNVLNNGLYAFKSFFSEFNAEDSVTLLTGVISAYIMYILHPISKK